MTAQQIRDRVAAVGPEQTVDELLSVQDIAACKTADDYATFCNYVKTAYPEGGDVFIAGSGNWGFSLNPNNSLRPFGQYSDIDVGVIHPDWFNQTWEQLRLYQRQFFYQVPGSVREALRRTGENVYCGFASPRWIPDKGNNFRFAHIKILNALSSHLVGYLPVRMLFFKNRVEAIDYYKRGVLLL
jgi:hypothetical protein